MSDDPVKEVVVIGSGFGGSAAAVALAEAGISVTMIERGPWRDTVPVRSMGVERRVPYPRGWGLYTGFLRTLNVPFLPGGRVTMNCRGLFELFVLTQPGGRLLVFSGGRQPYLLSGARASAESELLGWTRARGF